MLSMQNFVYDGHPILRQVAKEVKIPLSDEDKEIMRLILEYIKNSQNEKLAKKYKLREGIGLAAPQIGLDKRIFAIHVEDEDGVLHSHMLANPKLVSHSEDLIYLPGGEGCLSVKEEIEGIVPRYRRVKITGYNENSELIEIKANGFIAIVLQHEYDHLNGKMFYDHINPQFPHIPPTGAVSI